MGGSNGGGSNGAAMAEGSPPKLLLAPIPTMGGGGSMLGAAMAAGAVPKPHACWLAGPSFGTGGTQEKLFAAVTPMFCLSSQAWPLGVRGWPSLCQAYLSYATCKEQERRCTMKWIYSYKELFE